jgi:hypothetical protein
MAWKRICTQVEGKPGQRTARDNCQLVRLPNKNFLALWRLKCQQCALNLRDDPGLVAIYPNP